MHEIIYLAPRCALSQEWEWRGAPPPPPTACAKFKDVQWNGARGANNRRPVQQELHKCQQNPIKGSLKNISLIFNQPQINQAI